MLKRTVFISTLIIILAISTHINAGNINIQAQDPAQTTPEVTKEETTTPKQDEAITTADIKITDYKEVSPMKLIDQPEKYINKKIKFKAKFDKFSALGLDYPPVKRESKTHISFLIKKETVTNYNIPLSELKLILKRDYAEKELVNLETGDDIEVFGNVFSTALGDPWVDVEKLTILTPKKDKEETKNNESNEGK